MLSFPTVCKQSLAHTLKSTNIYIKFLLSFSFLPESTSSRDNFYPPEEFIRKAYSFVFRKLLALSIPNL